ncbi:sulfur oxidation c-type cytochrome SoxX [Undibacterium pigrum]|uniref:Monoheme cytochrome SoxX (Sulfur oxidation) n=1 Tax=Undibacterium pigrum TaxID=401470 RepID=A0A318IS86_9BURK|nr:sulfur oxidation c-type cytochrome SoxX [Undibacterium pigrum]PXX37873.1 monoheme cytochrome SoxX (sulfur oxidation) [Undibacterium pigrum]
MRNLRTRHISILLAAICSTAVVSAAEPDYAKAALDMMKADFKAKGPATMERMVQQDEAQAQCSANPQGLTAKQAKKLEQSQLATVKYPADAQYMGDWKNGEKIAQNGRGMQSSDAVGSVNGGNCYACHQMSKTEISFGNIGPSLYQYGKLRGTSPEILKYTWGKLYNAQAYNACSKMPRFGHNGVLTEAQLKDVMALLLDGESPVNK